MKEYWRNGGIAPLILDLGIIWMWVVSFTIRPLYPWGKGLWYPLDRRLCGPENRSGRGGGQKYSQLLPGLEPPIIQPVVPTPDLVPVTFLFCVWVRKKWKLVSCFSLYVSCYSHVSWTCLWVMVCWPPFRPLNWGFKMASSARRHNEMPDTTFPRMSCSVARNEFVRRILCTCTGCTWCSL